MPDVIAAKACEYYTEEEARRYDAMSAMRKMQRLMTARALELMGLPAGALVLDIGCGTGFSMETIEESGHRTVGVDISPAMAKIAREKKFCVALGDMLRLPFLGGRFDAALSISTIQWTSGRDADEVRENYRAIASECHRVLKRGGKIVVQFYPASAAEFEMALREFRRAGFGGFIAEDQSGTKKEKKYVVLHRN